MAAAAEKGWVHKIGTYVLHALVASVIVFLTSMLFGVILGELLGAELGDRIFARPIYPGEIVCGFLAGLVLNRRSQSKSAAWVWIPTATLLSTYFLPSERTDGFASTAAYLFGPHCGDCFEQVVMVSPFYASVAYSIGAWVALRWPANSSKPDVAA